MANPTKVLITRDEPVKAQPEQRAESTVDTRTALQKRIEEKAQSRAFNPKFRQGKNQLFELDNYGTDYTAGGFLRGRFVANTPARISIMKAQGFDFPKGWDSELENVEFGGLTLMLQESKHAAERRRQIESLALQQEAAAHVTDAVKEGKLDLDKDLQKTEKKYETFQNKPQRSPVGPD